MIRYRFSQDTSALILLGLVLITAIVWYFAYKADVIGNAWLLAQGYPID